MKALHMVTFILLVIGGLNWGVYGIFGWEIGNFLGGMDGLVARIVYILVGLSAVWALFTHRKECRECSAGGMSAPAGGQM